MRYVSHPVADIISNRLNFHDDMMVGIGVCTCEDECNCPSVSYSASPVEWLYHVGQKNINWRRCLRSK